MTRTLTAREQIDKAMSEDELLQAIVKAALFMNWLVHHDRRSDKALQQGSAGFPDLVLARNGRVKYFELKSAKGQLTAEQWAWRLRNYPLSVDRGLRCVQRDRLAGGQP